VSDDRKGLLQVRIAIEILTRALSNHGGTWTEGNRSDCAVALVSLSAIVKENAE